MAYKDESALPYIADITAYLQSKICKCYLLFFSPLHKFGARLAEYGHEY
jgi:hypothetical protein